MLDDMQRIDGLMPTEITFAVLIRACQESALHKRAEGSRECAILSQTQVN